MSKFQINRESCDDLGFAVRAMSSRIISIDEFKDWAYHVIENENIDDIPSYFYNLLEIKGPYFSARIIMDIVGFYPPWMSTDDEEDALYGVGYKRDVKFTTDAIRREDALSALSRNPHIEQRFRDSFPFIEF